MDLRIGAAYLCEVWDLPPDVACNGTEAKMRVMRYGGEFQTDKRLVKVVRCIGGEEFRMYENSVMQSWTALDGVGVAWKVIPIRELKADTAEDEGVLVGPVLSRPVADDLRREQPGRVAVTADRERSHGDHQPAVLGTSRLRAAARRLGWRS